MSFDDSFAAEELVGLYETFGIDGTVQRGASAEQPVRIVVDRGQARTGEHGQVIALVDVVRFMSAQWVPVQGDWVRWTDRLGNHNKQVDSVISDDGLEARAVLYG